MLNGSAYPAFSGWAKEMLLKWHRADPVSDKEINRNEGVYLRQGNRNPFIDHPELAEYIWGNHANETYYVSDTPITGDAVLVTPVQGTSFEFGEVAVGSSQTVYVTIKGQNIVGPLSVRSFGANASCFKISTNSLVASQVNSDDGVQLPIVYTPSSIGDHKSQIVIYDGGLSGSFTADLHGVGCEVPTMVAPVATDASDITDTSFTANWLAPEGITVDYYTVTLTTYNPGGENRTDEYTTESTYYAFSEMDASCTYSYSVTAHRILFRTVKRNHRWLGICGKHRCGKRHGDSSNRWRSAYFVRRRPHRLPNFQRHGTDGPHDSASGAVQRNNAATRRVFRGYRLHEEGAPNRGKPLILLQND